MPFLQPYLTRSGSGSNAVGIGGDFYIPNKQGGGSGSNLVVDGDILVQPTTPGTGVYFELNTNPLPPQFAIVAPSSLTTSISLNETQGVGGASASVFQIINQINNTYGEQGTIQLIDRMGGGAVEKGQINFFSSISGGGGGVNINGQANSYINVADDIYLNSANNIYLYAGAGDSVQVPTTMNVSSLNVSSINNGFIAKPYPVSTISAGGSTTQIPQNGVAWPLSGDIPIIAGHTYNISAWMQFYNIGAANETVIYIIGAGQSVLPILAYTYHPTDTYGKAGTYSVQFKALLTGNAQVIAYNYSTTNNTQIQFLLGDNPFPAGNGVPQWIVQDLGILPITLG